MIGALVVVVVQTHSRRYIHIQLLRGIYLTQGFARKTPDQQRVVKTERQGKPCVPAFVFFNKRTLVQLRGHHSYMGLRASVEVSAVSEGRRRNNNNRNEGEDPDKTGGLHQGARPIIRRANM
jgi:hypothetical protein